ncbi:pyridoxal-phosphate dependent enzyme [Sedimentibacter sp. zth1]|uniref:1-aminocyclopropane-1-carboxylate deaminase/D-cysteine desulfhydrase n=1 Tax=Sedimentibacter sp. zth1 TaxID=2816908 RepID=UPI001A91E3E5|nr:pyridoxal-phosphate dependent enzyme [Sedimentibacter sp. zth1]QSX05278.1 pyridoxal-phosphate dependent enzyme [Sedimentibacter sp. zth1]
MKLGRLQKTPVQKLNEKLNNNTFYIKRDDLLPISFGGNKARKAVLFFEELDKLGCNCVVTYGSSSSNHCRIVANIAASMGLPCFIISPNETSKKTFNSQMMRIFRAEIINCSVSEVKYTIKNKLKELKDTGYKPYFIQGGGHGDIGTKAYVQAYEEIKDYENKTKIHFDYIFHTSGTGTTQAGLICGQLIHRDNRKIIGISNARKNPNGGQVVFDSVNSYLTSIDKEHVTADVINFIDTYVLDGYGAYNDKILQTIKEMLINEGIPMDTTYTGKGFWGMKEYIRENQIIGCNILFIHTGGTPLFFDDLEVLVND